MIDWFKANLLTINLKKTECLLFHRNNSNSPLNLELELGTHTIKSTDQVKFLGLWIDTKLQWTLHTNTLLMKLKQNTNLLKVGNRFLSKSSKKLVYYAHIYSPPYIWTTHLGKYDRLWNQKKTTKEYGHMFQFNNTPTPYTL